MRFLPTFYPSNGTVPQTLTPQVAGHVTVIGPSLQRGNRDLPPPQDCVTRRCRSWNLKPRALPVLCPLPMAPGWEPSPHSAAYPPRTLLRLMLSVSRVFWGQAGSTGTHWPLCLFSWLGGQQSGERVVWPSQARNKCSERNRGPFVWLSVGEGCCQLPPHVMKRPSPSQRFAHHP